MSIFTDKAKIYVPRLMKDLQISRVQACGIFGNIGTETGGFLHLQEISPVVKGSKGGYGWFQWTGPRRRKYEAWCKMQGLDAASDEANYKYIVKETSTDEMHSLAQLKKTTTVEAATETFMAQNLRPGVKHLENRIKWARIAEEATRVPVEETAVVAGPAVVATGVAVADPVNWHWYLLGAIGAMIVGWLFVKMIKEKEAVQPEVVSTKKGKKNGKA